MKSKNDIPTLTFAPSPSYTEDPESRTLLQFRGTPHYDQFHPTWLERIDDLTPEAIANPFQSPSHALRSQRKRRQAAVVKDPKLWQERAARPRLPQGELPERISFAILRNEACAAWSGAAS